MKSFFSTSRCPSSSRELSSQPLFWCLLLLYFIKRRCGSSNFFIISFLTDWFNFFLRTDIKLRIFHYSDDLTLYSTETRIKKYFRGILLFYFCIKISCLFSSRASCSPAVPRSHSSLPRNNPCAKSVSHPSPTHHKSRRWVLRSSSEYDEVIHCCLSKTSSFLFLYRDVPPCIDSCFFPAAGPFFSAIFFMPILLTGHWLDVIWWIFSTNTRIHWWWFITMIIKI